MPLRTLTNVIFVVVFVPLTIVLTAIVVLSLQWRMVHDSPYIMYFAFLIDRLHFIPYRDFYDINLTGSYALDIVISKILDYTDFALHSADVAFFVLIAALTWVWQKRFGRKVAGVGIVLFGLNYFVYGPAMSFQRE